MSKGVPKVRAVLFDLGGTLVDVRDFPGWVDLARRVYLDLDADALAHYYGEVEREFDPTPPGLDREASRVEFWHRILSRASGTPLDRKVATKYVRMLGEGEPSVRLFSDARRCLDQMRGERRHLGIVSNSTSEASVRRILDRVGILDYFERVVSSGTEGIEKPAAEIFRRATARLGVTPPETVHVGDLPNTDARGAAAAGLHGVWLNREGMEAGDDPPEIMSLLELPIVLRRIESGDPGRGPTRL